MVTDDPLLSPHINGNINGIKCLLNSIEMSTVAVVGTGGNKASFFQRPAESH